MTRNKKLISLLTIKKPKKKLARLLPIKKPKNDNYNIDGSLYASGYNENGKRIRDLDGEERK